MNDKPVSPVLPEGRDLIAHALYLGSAITDAAAEPAEVIANAKPIAAWLAAGDGDDLDRRLIAGYQQLNNQRGVGCEVNLFVERAETLYRFLCETTAPAAAGSSSPADTSDASDASAPSAPAAAEAHDGTNIGAR